MPRTRFKCPSVNRSVIASELAEENYLMDLLPVRGSLFSDADVFNCNGDVERRETVALEVLPKCTQVLDGDNNAAMDIDVDILYPTRISEMLMSQLLSEPLVSCASDEGEVLIRPAKACVWFDEDTSTKDSMTYGSGGLSSTMELDVEDLPGKPIMQSKIQLLAELSSPVDTGADEDFKKLKVQDLEAEPISSPVTPSEEIKLQESIRTLDDAMLQTSIEADCRLAVEPSEETQARDSGMWNFPEMPDSQNVEPCATPNMIPIPKAKYDCEDLADDLSCLHDSFGAAPSILDDHATDLGVATQPLQQSGPCSVSVWDTFLEDSSMDSSIRTVKLLQVQNMSENLKIIKNDRLEQSPSSKHRSCDPGVETVSNSVWFGDLTGPDDSSLSCSKPHETEENSGIRHQERQIPVGTGASVSTSVLKYEDYPCTAANNDNSDHSTLSDEKTTCSTAPSPCYFKFDSTRSIIDLSLINETHACKEAISQIQSSEANPKNCVLRQNSARQEKAPHAIEATHQQSGSTSVAAASFDGVPWAVTAPYPPASTAPLEYLKTEELHTEKFSGLRDVKMMEKQPLVIVAVNVMQPNGPVLPRRRSFYPSILSLENKQLQVVERERHLPVDLILSPSTCLIVYTAETMKLDREKNPSLAKKECHGFIVDIIVNCQMKAMSFSFGKCFMVFEGDSAFTSIILQATKALAVAAACFGMQLQCFVSRSPQCTEDIALRCIERIQKEAKRPYPSLMSECETDEELFLEQFPSLNPQAAHAILCLNVPLSKFILWSQDAMADALQGFEVPKESLKLFKLQSAKGKLMEVQAQRSTTRPEETYLDNFPFLPPASSEFGYFETTFSDDLERSNHGNLFYPSLDRSFVIDPLGDGLTSEEHITFGPSFGLAFPSDSKFDEELTSERCFNFRDDPYQLSKQEHLPVEPWPEATPTQRPTTQRNSNRSQKPANIQTCLSDEWIGKMKRGIDRKNSAYSQTCLDELIGKMKRDIDCKKPAYTQTRLDEWIEEMKRGIDRRKPAYTQTSLDEWIEKMKRNIDCKKPAYTQTCLDEWIEEMKRDVDRTKRESECKFLNLAKLSIPSPVCQQDLFPTSNFELHGRENGPCATINITPAKRAASALDLFRNQKGMSRPRQKKLKSLSRPRLRPTVVDISTVQVAQAHLSKRFCFKPVPTFSRFSRSS